MQQINRPKLTLRFKLLVGVTLLQLSLMASSFTVGLKLLSNETRSYTFEVQSNQVQLMASQFSSLVKVAFSLSKTLAETNFKNNALLQRQSEVKNLEAFGVNGPVVLPAQFTWGKLNQSFAPDAVVRDELRKNGIAYRARYINQNAEIHVFTVVGPRTIIRAELNIDDLTKQTSGSHSQIVDATGTLLFDARDYDKIGTKIDPEDTLYKMAQKSIVAVGTHEYESALHGGEPYLGTYAIPGFKVFAFSAIKVQDAMRGAYQLLEKIVLAGVFFLGLSLILVVFFSARLTGPLTKLTEATHEVASGNFDLQLDERSEDEIGMLSKSMNRMSRQVRDLLIERIESVRVEQEVAVASALQKNLIPPSLIETKRYLIRSFYQAAQKCGGDWWGTIETNDCLYLIISDATGHGLPPAMLTATMHGCFSALQKIVQDSPSIKLSPEQLLTVANRMVIESSKGELNMTMLIAAYHFQDRTLTLSSAGHNPPWIIRRKDGLVKSVDTIKMRSPRLGEGLDFTPAAAVTVPFSRDDSLFMYTDGLIENQNSEGLDFGSKRVKEVLGSSSNLPGTMDRLQADIKTHYENTIIADDVSFVLFQGTA